MEKSMRDIKNILITIAILFILSIIGIGTLVRLKQAGCIALIPIHGMIEEDRPIIQSLHRFNDLPQVKAIVLYIDSSGGTFASSQSIFEEIQKIRQQGKPIVASISTVGTSGGYYIACGSDLVFAQPGSITGSVGVILRYPEAVDLLRKLGLRVEVVQSGAFKDMGDYSRKMTPAEQRLLQEVIDDLYDQFLDMLLDRRGTVVARLLAQQKNIKITDVTPEAVELYLRGLCDGRIFTGRQAYQWGFVDELGNLDDAVRAAAQMARLPGKPRVIQEPPPSWWQRIQGSGGYLTAEQKMHAAGFWVLELLSMWLGPDTVKGFE